MRQTRVAEALVKGLPSTEEFGGEFKVALIDRETSEIFESVRPTLLIANVFEELECLAK